MKRYVVGIIGSGTQCLFVSKQRPDWQVGKLNGVGGKVEDDESPIDAIERECFEECGLITNNWVLIGTLARDNDYIVYYYYANMDSIQEAFSKTDEEVVIVDLSDLDYATLVPPTDIYVRFCLNPFYKPLYLEAL